MLDVIAVIEQERVVQRSVMAGCAAGMLVVAVERAQGETAQVPRQVSRHEERRGDGDHCPPEDQYDRSLQDDLAG
jgi:hypothetical protein